MTLAMGQVFDTLIHGSASAILRDLCCTSEGTPLQRQRFSARMASQRLAFTTALVAMRQGPSSQHLIFIRTLNRTIAIASDFRVDGAKSPEIPQKEGVLDSQIAARNRKSLAISGVRDGHRNRKSQKSLRFRCAKSHTHSFQEHVTVGRIHRGPKANQFVSPNLLAPCDSFTRHREQGNCEATLRIEWLFSLHVWKHHTPSRMETLHTSFSRNFTCKLHVT